MKTNIKQRKKSIIITIYDDASVNYRIGGIDYTTSVSRLKSLEPCLSDKLIKASKVLGGIKITAEEAEKIINISFEVLPKKDSELSPYELYRKQVEKAASDKSFPRPNDETPQTVLWIKAIGCEIIETEFKDENTYTFKDGDKFGFSEYYVNKLMEIAYLSGIKQKEDLLNDYKFGLKEALIRGFENMLDDILD